MQTISTNSSKACTNGSGESFETIDALPSRVREIATLRGLGYSFREIAGEFRVTPQAVSLMLSRHRRVLKRLHGASDLHGLSARAVNTLGRHGINNPRQARQAKLLELIRHERNCGRKTMDELRRWMENEAGSA